MKEDDKIELFIIIGMFTLVLIGFVLGCAYTRHIYNPKSNTYYMTGTYFSPDSVVTTDGNVWCVSEINIDKVSTYLLTFSDNGTKEKEDDVILDIVCIY